MEKRKKVSVLNFGCRLNQADGALIYGRLAEIGFEPSDEKNSEKKDLFVINTCTVTSSASQKGRQAARRARKNNPFAKIAVTGCDVEVNKDFWLKENAVDIVIPGSRKDLIAEFVSQDDFSYEGRADETLFREEAGALFPFRKRAFVKIQEGCDGFCAFCIVPYARGKPRSRARDEILDEIKKLVSAGRKEVVLTGVNICLYRDGKITISKLVENILSIEGDFRLRLSSTELHPEMNPIISIMRKNKRLCRFIHVPLQHGHDDILRKMKRPHLTSDFAKFAEDALTIDGLHLGTDIICGLPGETDGIFEESASFIKKIGFANIHIFRYSPRRGTEAVNFAERPHSSTVKKRMKILDEIRKTAQDKFLLSQIGREASFIGEKKAGNNCLIGWSDNYIKTLLQSHQTKINALVGIRFTEKISGRMLRAEEA
jgi:threonylcarbamoyladenosine tRNA methylthiotransferase MtaB